MNLKSLSNAEMIHVSAEMVTPRREAHAALMAVPATAGLVPLVAAAHEALAAIEGRAGKDAREAELPRVRLARFGKTSRSPFG